MSRKSLEIMETRKRVYMRDDYVCQYPGCSVMGFGALQLAHRIRQGQEKSVVIYWRENFGEDINLKQASDILNNDFNLVSMCSVHNSSVDITFNPLKRKNLLDTIYNNR